jgi:glycerol-3-phosphate dehydrogenase
MAETPLKSLKPHYKAIVVGGGVNGVGIARDLALRGVDCLLVEKKDFSQGTSWASSGMIHGGPRYLLDDPEVTRLSCLDSGYIQNIAPHLLFRIPFLYPIYQKPGEPKIKGQMLLESVDTFFSVYDRYSPLKNGKPHVRLSAEGALALEPGIPSENLLGAVSFDEWGIDVPRLCIANVMDAKIHGATCLNHTEVTQVNSDNDQFQSVELQDTLTGETKTISADVLINATGPWAPQFAEKMGVPLKLRGSKGIHLVFDRRLFNMAITANAIDGREIFIMPYENTTIIGTTDDDYFGDLDEQRSEEDEIKYLLEGIRRVFPAVDEARMIYSYSGVRPTLYEREKYESALSREHEVLDHERLHGQKGMVSLIGGKLASYRIMAEETADLVCKKLGVKAKCQTHEKSLPGGDHTPDVMDLSLNFEQNPMVVSRLVYRHGSLAVKILEMMQKDPEKAKLICPCEPVSVAEIEYVIENEFVRTLSDLKMRTRWTMGPCQGTECLLPGAHLFEKLVDDVNDVQKNHVPQFMNEWWWNRAAVLTTDQLKQEELFQAIHFRNHGLAEKSGEI